MKTLILFSLLISTTSWAGNCGDGDVFVSDNLSKPDVSQTYPILKDQGNSSVSPALPDPSKPDPDKS